MVALTKGLHAAPSNSLMVQYGNQDMFPGVGDDSREGKVTV
jgi:hypothetical protein